MTVRITTYIPPKSDETSEKFINYLMLGGKKTVARSIFNNMLAELERRGHKESKATFLRAIENCKPLMEVRPKRVGGSIYQVPFEVTPRRQQMLAFRWLIGEARGKKGMAMYRKLAQSIQDASENTGTAIKKKDDVERMAAANRAFSHYARFTKKKK